MLYLKLFHGRRNSSEQLDDWGTDGPIFGPYQYAHTTYSHHLKMGRDPDDVDELFVTPEDLIYYDGIYYGDWSVFPANLLEKHDPALRQTYDPIKAKIPELQNKENKNDCKSPVKIIVYIRGGVCLNVKTNLPDTDWEYGLVDYDNDPDLPVNYVPFREDKMKPLPSFMTMQSLIHAATGVIEKWETGDLAAAVRCMANILKKIDC